MVYVLTFLSGFAAGVVLDMFLEKRALKEIERLRTYLAAEFEKLSVRM